MMVVSQSDIFSRFVLTSDACRTAGPSGAALSSGIPCAACAFSRATTFAWAAARKSLLVSDRGKPKRKPRKAPTANAAREMDSASRVPTNPLLPEHSGGADAGTTTALVAADVLGAAAPGDGAGIWGRAPRVDGAPDAGPVDGPATTGARCGSVGHVP